VQFCEHFFGDTGSAVSQDSHLFGHELLPLFLSNQIR
jgi:hypothetical protein